MTAEPEKLLVPAELYDEALVFCNARRAERGMEPITELPAGLGGFCRQCPCARAVSGLWVAANMYYWLNPVIGLGIPHNIGRFVIYFDKHAANGVATKPVRAEQSPGCMRAEIANLKAEIQSLRERLNL